MAKRDGNGRLRIPKDIWDSVQFNDYHNQTFGFFLTEDSRVVIMHIDVGSNFDYEFLGKCTFDEKYRFYLPRNVDTYLGNGDIYYFTTYLSKSCIYVYKLDQSVVQKRQNLQLQTLLAIL